MPARGATMEIEVIALLPQEERPNGRPVSRALVRHPDGRIALEDLGLEAARAARARFRRSNPIVCPSTREVIGYEMEQVLLPASA